MTARECNDSESRHSPSPTHLPSQGLTVALAPSPLPSHAITFHRPIPPPPPSPHPHTLSPLPCRRQRGCVIMVNLVIRLPTSLPLVAITCPHPHPCCMAPCTASLTLEKKTPHSNVSRRGVVCSLSWASPCMPSPCPHRSPLHAPPSSPPQPCMHSPSLALTLTFACPPLPFGHPSPMDTPSLLRQTQTMGRPLM
jgi:hypothetical protein